MSTKIKTRPFDIAEYLDDDEAIAMYLNGIMEEDNPSLLADALGNIAKAKGMTQIAKASGIGRESLYKALKPDAQPRYETVSRVCKALGMRLRAEVVSPSKHPLTSDRSPHHASNALCAAATSANND